MIDNSIILLKHVFGCYYDPSTYAHWAAVTVENLL